MSPAQSISILFIMFLAFLSTGKMTSESDQLHVISTFLVTVLMSPVILIVYFIVLWMIY
jgi:hypothetical protein